jgi:hypothetical protein
MSLLPVLYDDGTTRVLEPATGEMLPVAEASNRAILEAAERAYAQKGDLSQAGHTLAEEMARRQGFGIKHDAGYEFKVEVTRSWSKGGTGTTLRELVKEGEISRADYENAMPLVRVPSATKCKALVERLMLDGRIKAAKRLSEACSVSAARISKIKAEAVQAEAEEITS